MNIDVFKEASALYDKYKLCEELLEYLSKESTVKGHKYKELLAKFADSFMGEFMMFVHERMTACGEAFEECGKCNCENCPAENPEQPEIPDEPKEPKFAIGSKVEILTQPYESYVGVAQDFNPADGNYYVVSNIFSMWFPEKALGAYTEEVEQPEEPTGPKFSIGDKVVITVPEYNGATAAVADYNEADGYLLVDIEGQPDETMGVWFPEEVLAPYVAPEKNGEWVARNDGAVTGRAIYGQTFAGTTANVKNGDNG